MRSFFALPLILAAAACAPSTGALPSAERGGQSEVVADFSFAVGRQVISGSYDPRIFEKNRVLGHVRRSCKQFSIADYRETRRAARVSFQVRCRISPIEDARGQWVVLRGEGGNEVARKL